MDGNQSDNSSINHQRSPIPIQITYGYSRDHRPDLKQFILDLFLTFYGLKRFDSCPHVNF
jgi:transposase